jgi:hypothetical protein
VPKAWAFLIIIGIKFSSFKYLVMRLFFTALLFIGSSFIAINAQDGKIGVRVHCLLYCYYMKEQKQNAGAC